MTTTTTTTAAGSIIRYVDMSEEAEAANAPRWYDGQGIWLVLALLAAVLLPAIIAG